MAHPQVAKCNERDTLTDTMIYQLANPEKMSRNKATKVNSSIIQAIVIQVRARYSFLHAGHTDSN